MSGIPEDRVLKREEIATAKRRFRQSRPTRAQELLHHSVASLVPDSELIAGESSLFIPVDVARLTLVGISTFLVGESLIRQAAAATRKLFANGRPPH